MKSRKFAALTATVSIAIAPQIAAAKQCVTQQELSAMAIYAVPALLDTMAKECRSVLPKDSFLISGSGPMRARYDGVRGAYWPTVSKALVKIAANEEQSDGAATLGMLEKMPEQAVRPMVDALLMQELGPEIDAEACKKADPIARALAPLDPEEMGGVLSAIVFAALDDDKGRLCKIA